jgi:YfiR/HmsC-like
MMSRIRRIRPLWLALAVTLAVARDAGSQSASEYATKAAFVYSFAKFVEWPPNAFTGPDAPVVIGIVGKDPFGRGIDDVVRGQTAGGRSVVVRRLDAASARNCHILFISTSERQHFDAIISGLTSGTILTVSDVDDFAASGGMIGLHEDEGRIRLEINLDAAQRAGLKVSSKLIGAARIVSRGPGR